MPDHPKILFEDTHVIVLSKPAGLLSQGEKTGDPNLVDWLRTYLGRPYVGLVHRLDRNTSGIMIVAKRTKSARRLTEALVEGKLKRTYLAWVHGSLTEAQRWVHFLEKDPVKNQTRVVKSGGRAKEAILSVRPLHGGSWEGAPLTLVEFELETGRSHQIRAQSSYEGHPLLGDTKYAEKGQKDSFPRPALHSFRLSFPHPMTEEILMFEDKPPPDFNKIK